MSMIYDEGTFQKFRALAVTKVEDMQVGKTYYSNDPGDYTNFIVVERIKR